MLCDIYIYEKETMRTIRIPWLPETITVSGNKTKFAEYDIMDKGEAKIPNGRNLTGYSWESTFPGVKRYSSVSKVLTDPMLRGIWLPTATYTQTIQEWKDNGSELQLLVIGKPINADVYVEDFTWEHTGGFGDVDYKLSFIEAVQLASSISNTANTTNAASTAASSVTAQATARDTASTTTYTVKSGDTLWSISQKTLGSGSKWESIYSQNSNIIESAANQNRGSGGSEHGHWIYPGTVITIPA